MAANMIPSLVRIRMPQNLSLPVATQTEPEAMSAAAKGGGGGGAAPPPEPGGASGGGQVQYWPTGRLTGTDRGGPGASSRSTRNEMPIDLSASPTEGEVDTSATETEVGEGGNAAAATNTANAGGKRRRGGVGVRRRPASRPVAAAAAASAAAQQPQAAVEPAPVAADGLRGGSHDREGSNLLFPFDVDAMVFGPGGLRHDPEADERERLARERWHQYRAQQEEQQVVSAAASAVAAGISRPAVAASTDDGPTKTSKNASSVVSTGGSNQRAVAVAALGSDSKSRQSTAGVSTLAMAASGQAAKQASASISRAAGSGDRRTNSEAAASSSKPSSSVYEPSAGKSMNTTAAPADPSPQQQNRPSIADGDNSPTSSKGSVPRSEGIVAPADSKNDATVGAMGGRNGGAVEDKSADIVIVEGTSGAIANGKDSAAAASGSAAGVPPAGDEEKKSDGEDAATASAKPKAKRVYRKSIISVLRKRKAGSEHDQEAIDACSTFIETQLLTKTCTNRINNYYSTKCTCIKSLDPALVRPAATYAATTWNSMSEDEKIDQILEWNRNKAGGDLSYRLPAIQAGDDSPLEKQVCRNALAEVLGISTALWSKVLRVEKSEKADESSILNEASAYIDAKGSEAVDACADFIQSYFMKKNCTNRSIGFVTSCSCMKNLDKALIRPAAAYISSTWGKMDQKEKVDQLVLWIGNQSEGTLPFELPIEADPPMDASQPQGTKMICRNALIELLCISNPLWDRAYGRASKAATPASAADTSQPLISTASACDSSTVQPAVNPIMFGPMVGNPTKWAQFHAQAQASTAMAVTAVQQRKVSAATSSAGGQSERYSAASLRLAAPPTGSTFDKIATEGGASERRGETTAAGVSRQEAQRESDKRFAIIPVTGHWSCDKCKVRVFDNFDDAQLHEETCTGALKSADEAAPNEPAAKVSQGNSNKPDSTSSTPSRQDMSEGAAAAEGTSAHPSNDDDDDLKYVCDKCKVAEFLSFDEACKHESTCSGATPEGEKTMVMAFTPRKAKDGEIAADANATIESAVLTNIAALCKQERWADVANLISTNPTLAAATFRTNENFKTSILHEAIMSKGDVNGRAGMVRSVLSARPSAAAIKRSCGSLPIHVLANRKCNVNAKVKQELLRALAHAYPASIGTGNINAQNTLHLILSENFSADICRTMLTLQPDAAKMRDKSGWLPIHVACSRHCSLGTLRVLVNACPESIHVKTNDGKTPLMLARSSATARFPNRRLIRELNDMQELAQLAKGLQADSKGDTTSSSAFPASHESSSCEATAAESLLAVFTSPKRETSAASLPTAGRTMAEKHSEDEKGKPAKEGYVSSDPFFIGQDVWVKSGQTEHEAMVVSRGKAGNTKISVRWATAGFDQTVDIRQVRAMYSASDLDKPEGETLTSSTPALRRSTPRPNGTHQCGSCDACMVDDCGECKYCLDKPRFGGPDNFRKRCLHRPLCTVRFLGTTSATPTVPTKSKSKSKASGMVATDKCTPTATTAPMATSSAKRRTESRLPNTHQCGSCDACMVDDCGECKYCLDKPRFGGRGNSRRRCLYRPLCTVRGSSTKASKTTPSQSGTTKSVSSASKSEYKPLDIRVGMEIMKYFTDEGGGGKNYFEGALKRLPIPSSPYYFIVYSDGDKEEISEDDFWSAYSDYRVQKGTIVPSEFVPESLVVANDGRLATVRSFRPVSNGTDTTWSYRVHFTGLPASHDKWMLEVDLRKQTPSTLRWAVKVRAAVKKSLASASAKKPASISSGTKSISKQNPPTSTRPKASGKAPQENEGRSYPRSRAVTSIDSAQPPAKRAKASSSASSDATASDSVRHSRRAAAADARVAMSKTGGPKRLKKEKNLPKAKVDQTDDTCSSGAVTNNDTLPDIGVGTRILKYFAEGKQYYQGKITRLPGPGNSFYHIKYNDGDMEDMAPDEMWMAFSDWCVANEEISLTQFDPNQQVYAVDCLGVPREAVIQSFRPVEKEGSDKWSWSYLVHFVGWNRRHDDWIDEINIYKATPANKTWAEEIQEEVERRRQSEASPPKPSSRSSTPTGTPSRKRERGTDDSKGNSHQKKRWQCDRCNLLNDSNRRCSGCHGWKDGKMHRKSESQKDESYHKSILPYQKCIVDGCDRYKQSHCNRMCRTHNRESLGNASIGSGRDEDVACGPSPSMTCSVDGCDKWKRSSCDGMCRLHYSESQKQKVSVADEDSVASEESDEGWSCPLCQKQNGPETLTCSDACNGVRRCLALGCAEACQKDCDGMCTSHYQEALKAFEANDNEDEDDNGNSDAAMETDGTANNIPVAPSSDTRAKGSTTESSDDGANKKSSTEATSAAAATTESNTARPSADEGSGSDSNAACDADNANASSDTNTSGDGYVAAEGVAAPAAGAAAAAGFTDTVRSPGEIGEPNDGVDVSSPQPSAAATATFSARQMGQTPNLQNVLAALRQADSDDDDDDDDGDFGEVFGYFGSGL